MGASRPPQIVWTCGLGKIGFTDISARFEETAAILSGGYCEESNFYSAGAASAERNNGGAPVPVRLNYLVRATNEVMLAVK